MIKFICLISYWAIRLAKFLATMVAIVPVPLQYQTWVYKEYTK